MGLTFDVTTTSLISQFMKLRDEIKQTKPFTGLEEEAFLNLQRTAEYLNWKLAEVLGPRELSPTQYNALRILRGAGKSGLTCGEIGERMVTRDSDITRLLDRLEKRNLVIRTRDPKDRRVVITRITPKGLHVLAELDEPVKEFLKESMSRLGSRRLGELSASMEGLRG